MYFPAWQKAGKKVILLPTSDWGEIDNKQVIEAHQVVESRP